MKVEFRLFAGGWCSAPGYLAGGQGFKRMRFPALVAWIRHAKGELLFDTGYSRAALRRMKTFPSSIVGSLLQPSQLLEETLPVVLETFGTSVANISRVFISHFHYDHAASLDLFPEAKFLVHRDAWLASRNIPRLREGKAAFSTTLIPPDFERRAEMLEDSIAKPWEGFPHTWDLFGDGSLRAVSLPGHAPGQLGLVVQSTRGTSFLVADAAWLTANLLGKIPPAWVLKLVQSDASAWLDSLEKLRAFSKRHPSVKLIPSHCAATLAEFSA